MHNLRPFLALLLLFFGISSTHHAQEKNKWAFSRDFSADSLLGFDEDYYKQLALEEGLYGKAFERFMYQQKRGFINIKYNLVSYFETPVDPRSKEYQEMISDPVYLAGKIIGGGNQVNAAPCVNEGFELGNLTGWTSSRGTNTPVANGSCQYPVTPLVPTFPSSSLQVVNTSIVDPILGPLGASPFTGSFAVKLNDNVASGNADVVRISQTFPVTQSNFLYEFAYRAVMATAHPCCQQTFMRVSLRDFVGNLLACPLFTFAPPPPSGPLCSSPGIAWTNTTSGGFSVAYNPTWQKYSIDLTSYISSTVTIEVTMSDCSPTAHWGYVYFDSNCSQLGITLNNTVTIPAPTSTVNVSGQCAQTATLSAPGGLGPYNWNGPPLSGVTNNTNQTISATVAGDYTLSMNPPGSCLPIVRVVKLSFPPPTTITASPSATICTSGSNTVTTLSAAGAAQYTWNPGGVVSSSISVSPTVSTVYTLTARTGTCVGDYTFQVTVAPNPALVVLSSNAALCPGQTATLTGSGASTYSWLPVGLTGSLVTITQTATTTYTTIGTSAEGCISTATTSITQTTLAPATVIQIGGPVGVICPGTPLTFVGLGASSFTWYPVGSSGNPIVLTPTVTTTFTAAGSVGSCTNSALFTVTVDPGPSMTVSSTPSVICPGNSATLSSISPAALGFTWAPVASNNSFVVVTPTAPTVYSVSGHNALGCISTYTVAPFIAPVPVLTISPASPTVCVGSPILLTASGGSSYTWTPGGSTGSTLAVSPLVNTTYTLSGSNGTCGSTTSQEVTVVALPAVAASSSSTSICIGNSVTLSASGAGSYTWNPGGLSGTNVTVSPTVTTTYTLTGLSGNCSNTALITITVNTGPSLSPVASPTAICPGGTSNLSASGAVGYTWNPGGLSGSNVNVSPLTNTTYTLTADNAFGCLSTASVAVQVNPNPTISITASSSSVCAGSAVTFTANGGSSYTWNPGAVSGSVASFSPLANTTYTATGANAFGCLSQQTVAVSVVTIPVVSASAASPSICLGSSTNLTASGATTYSWNPGGLAGSPVSVSPTISTTYTLFGSTAGCTGTTSVGVTVQNGPTLNPVASPTAICTGGSSNLSASGALSYTWNPGGLSGANVLVSPTISTTYSVTGGNAIGCLTTQTVLVQVNPLPTLSIAATAASVCAGSAVIFTASGASTYTWNPGAFTGSILIDIPAGSTTYTLSGTSAFGCTSQTTIPVVVVPIPNVNASASSASICSGTSATLTAIGATNYTWNPGGFTSNPVSVSPTVTTTYTVTGNTAGCSNTATVSINVQSGPNMNPTASPTAICPGGISNLSASGALAYTWNPGGLSGANVTVSPLSSTIYSVTGSNAIGCLNTQTVGLTVNPAPSVSVSASAPSICVGGSAVLTASGAGFYNWSPGGLGGLSVTVSPLATTVYTVVGTNGFGCTGTNTIQIVVVPLPNPTLTANPSTICIGSSGTLSAIGAASYTWNPGPLTGPTVVVSPTATTIYTVGSFSAGCLGSNTIQLNVQNLPNVIATSSPAVICAGSSAVLSAIGAVNYTWNPGALTGASQTVSPASTTFYTVTGVSALGCTNTAFATVLVNPNPTITLVPASPTICQGSFIGISAFGAQTYTWLPGGSTFSQVTVNPSVTTTYTVIGTSSLGCVSQATITMTVVPLPALSVTANPAAICPGQSSTLTASGASTYSWSPVFVVGPVNVVTPTVSSTYSVFGTANSCINVATVSVLVNPTPTVSASASPTSICIGFSSTLSANGAASYTWNPGNLVGASTTVSPLGSTVYTVTGTSAAGCTANASASLTVNPAPTLSLSVFGGAICSGGSSTLVAAGAQSYTWNPGSLTGSAVVVSPSASTVYTVTGSSSAGCLAQQTTTVLVSPTPTVTAVTSPSSICIGNCATLTASGASSYLWSSGSSGSTALVCPTVSTTYSVLATTGSCSSTSTILVPVNALPVPSITASSASICSGASATLTASGAANYTWQPGGSNANSIVVNPATTTVYSLQALNANGCTGSTVFTLQVVPTPTVVLSSSGNLVCSGTTVTLSAIGANNYTWQPGGTSGSSLVTTATAITIYTVTGESASCQSSSTLGISVLPLPNVSAAANPSAVCSGNSTTLTANGAASYTWLPMNTNGAVVSDSPVGPTTYTVIGQAASGCTNTATTSIIVIFPPTLSISPSSTAICTGNSVTLTANGAASYTWLPGLSNAAAIVESPTVTSTYTLFGNNGGCVGVQTIQIVVNNLPVLSPSISSGTVCAGNTVSLTVSGASTYTWLPLNLSGAAVTDTPSLSVTYTVNGEDLNTCQNSATISVLVNPNPTILPVASATAICEGSTVNLSASGAINYTWSPIGLTGASVSDNPSLSIVYTVTGEDSNLCIGTETLAVQVVPVPTIVIAPQNSTICAGASVTLSASGANNYTWAPVSSNSASIVETPSVTTSYTVSGDNAGLCISSATAEIVVNPLPANVTASVSGVISCAGPTVDLFGASTDTNVSYFWSGPMNYTSSAQTATAVSMWGDYTLTVTDNLTGCISSVTVNVPTDYSIPSITLTASSSSITCAISQVTLNATNSTTNPAFAWTGPAGFSSSVQVITTTLSGVYSVTITDLSSSCTGTAAFSIDSFTNVTITATITPATCNGTVSNNNGSIFVNGHGGNDKFDLSVGSTYTGSATYTNATPIPAATGLITNTLANPSGTLAYTLRLFDDKGCVKDTVLVLTPTNCEITPLGLAKSIPVILTNADGSYDVTVKAVVKNYGAVTLTDVKLEEDLSALFPSPMDFSVTSAPALSGSGSGLVMNPNFDGKIEKSLTNTLSSQLANAAVDTILFTVRVLPEGNFGPFSNSIKGSASSTAIPSFTVVVADSSQNGLDPDPNANNNPLDNNEPTVFSLPPKLFFGLTKTGEAIKSDNNSFDFRYTVKVHNLGNDTLTNIEVKDSLFNSTVREPAKYSIRSKPSVTGSGQLTANQNYDGRNDTRLIQSGGKMPPGSTCEISFVINVVTDTVTVYRNSAFGRAFNLTSNLFVSDTSGNGTNPDINGNGVWNEPIDNVPTVLVVSNPTLFIPQGFSPNGDNINETFVIKGLPDGENELTIFNRWGNKVYYSKNYDNSWDGRANEGSNGNNKLPQGTYYYILKTGDGSQPHTGFLVLQY